MTTISSLMSTACALGVSIGVLLPVESVLILSSSGFGLLEGGNAPSKPQRSPLFEHSVPAPSSSRSARTRSSADKLLAAVDVVCRRVERRVAHDVNGATSPCPTTRHMG